MFVLPASSLYNNQQTQDTYLARGNGPSKVLVETMQDVTAHATGKNITAPDGVHTYPEILILQWKKGSNSATLTLTNPTIVVSQNPVVNTNAYPETLYITGCWVQVHLMYSGMAATKPQAPLQSGRLCIHTSQNLSGNM